jgi:hypothetical protein
MLIEKLIFFKPLDDGLVNKEKIPKIRTLKKEVPMVSNSFVGIEVEVEGIDRGMVLHYWGDKEDGSLRNNGVEYVTPPIRATEVPQALHELSKQIKAKNPRYDFSARTSVHVHVNVRDMTLQEVGAMSVLYLLFERAFFKFAGRNRDKSIFCVPYQDSLAYTKMVEHLIDVTNNNDARVDIFNKFHKYHAYNMKPIITFGTIEFRHMAGTMDEEILTTWVNLILCLKNYAMGHSLTDILSVAYELTTTSKYSILTQEVFGEYARYMMCDVSEEDMYSCILSIKEAFMPIEDTPILTKEVIQESAFGKLQGNKVSERNNLVDLIRRYEQEANARIEEGI